MEISFPDTLMRPSLTKEYIKPCLSGLRIHPPGVVFVCE